MKETENVTDELALKVGWLTAVVDLTLATAQQASQYGWPVRYEDAAAAEFAARLLLHASADRPAPKTKIVRYFRLPSPYDNVQLWEQDDGVVALLTGPKKESARIFSRTGAGLRALAAIAMHQSQPVARLFEACCSVQRWGPLPRVMISERGEVVTREELMEKDESQEDGQ